MSKFDKKYQHILTKEVLERDYAELKTLKAVAKIHNVSSLTIISYMNYYKIPYNKKVVYFCDSKAFSRETEEDFYWAGFMAADGNVSKENDIILSLAKIDIEHVLKFKNYLQSNSPVTSGSRNNRNIGDGICKTPIVYFSKFRIRSKDLAANLSHFNIVPNKTKKYLIPEWVLRHHHFKHFLRGYFEGDGWFTTRVIKGIKRISWGICGNKEVVEAFESILFNELKIHFGKIIKQKNIWKITVDRQHDVHLLCKYMYDNSTVYLDRKYEISKHVMECDDKTVILNLNKDSLEEAYRRLKTYKLVAKEFGCCASSIMNYCKKFGIKK